MNDNEFSDFYKKFFYKLYFVAKQLTKHHEDAEDLVHDAFDKKMEKIKNWNNGEIALFEYLKIVITGLFLDEEGKKN